MDYINFHPINSREAARARVGCMQPARFRHANANNFYNLL